MGRVNASKLRDKAAKLVEKGKYDKAVVIYHQLEDAEPQNADWSRRAADCYRRLDDGDEALQALTRAADKYAQAGFLVKAVAVCKMILAIDPGHTEALDKMAELQRERGIPAPKKRQKKPRAAAPTAPAAAKPAPAPRPAPAVAVPPAPPKPPPPASGPEAPPPDLVSREARRLDLGQPVSPPMAPGAALDSISLADIVPESREVANAHGVPSGIFEIPIDEDDIILEDAGPALEIDDGTHGSLDEAFAAAVDGNEFAGPDDIALEIDSLDEGTDVGEAARSVLPKTPLFSDLSPAALQRIIGGVELVELSQGEAVFSQGDVADAFYVVSEGAVAAIDEGPPRVQLGTIEEGQFFGEIGVVTDQPRGATVEAVRATELLKIQRDVVSDLVSTQPGALKVMLRFLRDRLIDNLVRTSPLFEPFQGAERAMLASRFKFLEVDAGAELVEQGQRAAGLYVLLTGRAEVIRDTDGTGERLATLGPGDIFGEMSLLSGEPAVANVRAVSKCFVLELPGDVFREVIMTHPQVLMFVGDLADQRRRQNESIVSGDEDYAEGHLDLF